ncbi:hypothetical protein AB0D67_38290 [Streptosporangium sp. NPDC048047]|uniref:hypothetical protein n=1 Tax=Streptosporangium sp. NPDC048047 TaxID=3155748 RepID=UPI00343247F6
MAPRKRPASRAEKPRRMELLQQLLTEGVTRTYVLAARLQVDERTIQRYLKEQEGGADRRIVFYTELPPRILQHMRCYPQTWFSARDLCRVLSQPRSYNSRMGHRALQVLQREGLVRARREQRDPSSRRMCTRYQITEAGLRRAKGEASRQ